MTANRPSVKPSREHWLIKENQQASPMKTENRGIRAAPAPLQDLMNSLVMERKKKTLEISAGACARADKRQIWGTLQF